MRPLTSQALTLESGHVYRLAGDSERQFVSVTEFIGSFFEPFDQWAIATKLCAEHDRYRDCLPEDLIAEWNAATRDGTRVHEEIEAYIRYGGTAPAHPKVQHACRWLGRYLPKPRFLLTPEVRIYSEEHGLAGTTDLLAFDQAQQIFLQFDWKTNKKIDRVPYNGKTGIVGPGRALTDCHLTRYTLQLSTYTYILETEYGVSPQHMALVHLTDDGAEPIAVEYERDTVVAMLEWRKKNGD